MKKKLTKQGCHYSKVLKSFFKSLQGAKSNFRSPKNKFSTTFIKKVKPVQYK